MADLNFRKLVCHKAVKFWRLKNFFYGAEFFNTVSFFVPQKQKVFARSVSKFLKH